MKKTPSKAAETTSMDMDEIQRLIELGDKKGLAEFEVEKCGVRVRIKYARDTTFLPYPAPVVSMPGVEAGEPRTSGRPSTAAPADSSLAEAEERDLFMVKSPIVGTFYAAPDPNSPSFIKIGDTVKVGQVLCIVEAMKLMNEIESEVAGEVVKVLVQNAQPVEYGEPLFAIRES